MPKNESPMSTLNSGINTTAKKIIKKIKPHLLSEEEVIVISEEPSIENRT
jgi:hypothetical protein